MTNKSNQVDIPKYITIIRRKETTDNTYCYVAFHPELPNNMSQGDTPKKAEENLVEVTELVLARLKADNLAIPELMSWQNVFHIFSEDEDVILLKNLE